MNNFVYRISDSGKFNVGFWDAYGNWHSDSLHESHRGALQRINELYGDSAIPLIHIWLEGGILQDIQASRVVDVVVWDPEEANEEYVDDETFSNAWKVAVSECVYVQTDDPIERYALLQTPEPPPMSPAEALTRMLELIPPESMNEEQRRAFRATVTFIDKLKRGDVR